MAHLLTETFAIAHHNTYINDNGNNRSKGNIVLGDMLKPHFVNLIAINHLARVTLIDPL